MNFILLSVGRRCNFRGSLGSGFGFWPKEQKPKPNLYPPLRQESKSKVSGASPRRTCPLNTEHVGAHIRTAPRGASASGAQRCPVAAAAAAHPFLRSAACGAQMRGWRARDGARAARAQRVCERSQRCHRPAAQSAHSAALHGAARTPGTPESSPDSLSCRVKRITPARKFLRIPPFSPQRQRVNTPDSLARACGLVRPTRNPARPRIPFRLKAQTVPSEYSPRGRVGLVHGRGWLNPNIKHGNMRPKETLAFPAQYGR